MTKHTPGPWKHSAYHGAVLTDTGHAVEVEVCVFPVMRNWHQAAPAEGTHATFDKQRANARLIAAAPDLLAAAEAALRLAENGGTHAENPEDPCTLCEIGTVLRAAIARAKGEK